MTHIPFPLIVVLAAPATAERFKGQAWDSAGSMSGSLSGHDGGREPRESDREQTRGSSSRRSEVTPCCKMTRRVNQESSPRADGQCMFGHSSPAGRDVEERSTAEAKRGTTKV
eukprot:593590-Rhodomonas_salina.1